MIFRRLIGSVDQILNLILKFCILPPDHIAVNNYQQFVI